MQKKIIICDDHILFSIGISEILKKFGNNYQVETFNDSVSCKTYVQNNQIDVFICDLNIYNTDGFVLINELRDQLVTSKTIILTAYFEDFLIQKAERMGIHAFLRKETTAEELIQVIELEINAPFYTNKNQRKASNPYTPIDESVANKFRLSKQEKEIIKLIIDGETSKDIARILFISKTTVDTHRKNINRKLEISNSSSLIKFAHENNLFS
ncbi:response regulator transcription factor [Flavobacterium sp.]|uniref:response regulator transcription factor n=1 Tax=Flavobacterium sp. TaxID=239 RepID=UPI002869ECE0|nr:response regulator transcription factor [Flavobacterium sp.]